MLPIFLFYRILVFPFLNCKQDQLFLDLISPSLSLQRDPSSDLSVGVASRERGSKSDLQISFCFPGRLLCYEAVFLVGPVQETLWHTRLVYYLGSIHLLARSTDRHTSRYVRSCMPFVLPCLSLCQVFCVLCLLFLVNIVTLGNLNLFTRSSHTLPRVLQQILPATRSDLSRLLFFINLFSFIVGLHLSL